MTATDVLIAETIYNRYMRAEVEQYGNEAIEQAQEILLRPAMRRLEDMLRESENKPA